MRFLMRLPVCRHLVAGEVLPGVVVPGGRQLDCVVMKLEVHQFEYCLEPEHDIQQDFAVMPHDATVLEGCNFVLPKLHKRQEIMPLLQTSHRYIASPERFSDSLGEAGRVAPHLDVIFSISSGIMGNIHLSPWTQATSKYTAITAR